LISAEFVSSENEPPLMISKREIRMEIWVPASSKGWNFIVFSFGSIQKYRNNAPAQRLEEIALPKMNH